MNKIIDKKKLSHLKKLHRTIGLCHGVFDLIHIGHIQYLEEAKKKVDVLVVSVTSGNQVNKTPNRPYFSNEERMLALSALDSVDYVVLSEDKTSIEIINLLKPNYYFKGPDYKNLSDDITGEIKNEINAVKKNSGIFYTTKTKPYSSSSLLNIFFNNYSKNIKDHLAKIKKKFPTEKKIDIELNKLKNLKSLIIGESIIDQYTFCEAIGKSGKEPVLNFEELHTDNYLGGALAIANHLSEFINKIHLISYIGSKLENISFIKKNIKKNILLDFFKKGNSPTILKKRMVENVDKVKIVGFYKLNDEDISNNEEINLIKKIRLNKKKYKSILVSDFNHGLITNKISNVISENFKHKYSLMLQANSNSLAKYDIKKFKFPYLVSINERELRTLLKDNKTDIKLLMLKLKRQIKCKRMIITVGKRGLFYLSENLKITQLEAFTNQYMDKIGAGDVVFALASVLFSSKVDEDLALLICSLGGLHSLNMMANEKNINYKDIKSNLYNLLK
jgi:rfaE bifunctional protein nucleotidyltransferase chain/domain